MRPLGRVSRCDITENITTAVQVRANSLWRSEDPSSAISLSGVPARLRRRRPGREALRRHPRPRCWSHPPRVERGEIRVDIDADREASALISYLDGVRLQWFYPGRQLPIAAHVRHDFALLVERLTASPDDTTR
jgi:hypothetical protein